MHTPSEERSVSQSAVSAGAISAKVTRAVVDLAAITDETLAILERSRKLLADTSDYWPDFGKQSR